MDKNRKTIVHKIQGQLQSNKKNFFIRASVVFLCLGIFMFLGLNYLPQIVESRKLAQKRIQEELEQELKAKLKAEMLEEMEGETEEVIEEEAVEEIVPSAPTPTTTRSTAPAPSPAPAPGPEPIPTPAPPPPVPISYVCTNEEITELQNLLYSLDIAKKCSVCYLDCLGKYDPESPMYESNVQLCFMGCNSYYNSIYGGGSCDYSSPELVGTYTNLISEKQARLNYCLSDR
jgi:hypothetical protein